VQTQGSLQEADLASLLQTMQSERATGRLNLDAGEQSCSLFFLFGHLFHATGPDGDGEAVVIRALSWTVGNYHFERRAKLGAIETVKSSPGELIAAAEDAEHAAAVAAGFASATPSLHTIEGQAGGVGDGGGSTPDSSASWTALENDARDPGRSGQHLAGQREPPLFPRSPSRTARRSRRQ
jgi:Domain of unknown function (DUF4388)